jgi:VWFA-related protein
MVSIVSLTGFAPLQEVDPAGVGASITQVDTSQFPKVTVYVSVTDENGEPVGVPVSQIVLRENGQVMQPEEVSGAGEDEPITTMLVMDVSGSMNHAGKLPAAKSAARAYVDQSRPQDYIGLVAFNTRVDYLQPLTSQHEKLYEAIEELKADKDTAMYDALARSIEYLEAVQGRVAIIALTDGLDNRSKISPQEVIGLIGPAGLSISTIGLGEPSHSTSALSALNEPALRAFSEQAGGVYGYANDAESLKALYELYGRALQSEYVITYTSPSELRDGVNRSLTVSIEDAGAAGAAAQNDAAPVSQDGQGKYNPGGLVPEVAEPASWSLFAILLVGLLVLLLVPTIIILVIRFFRSRRQGKVKIKNNSSRKRANVKLKS